MYLLEDSDVKAYLEQIKSHCLFEHLNSADSIKLFMRHYIYFIWSYTDQVKRLQSNVSGEKFSIVWTPNDLNRDLVAFVNHLVLNIESTPEFKNKSHFVKFMECMDAVGADTVPILNSFLPYIGDDVANAYGLKETDEGAHGGLGQDYFNEIEHLCDDESIITMLASLIIVFRFGIYETMIRFQDSMTSLKALDTITPAFGLFWKYSWCTIGYANCERIDKMEELLSSLTDTNEKRVLAKNAAITTADAILGLVDGINGEIIVSWLDKEGAMKNA
jgi:hypothetical protein